MKFVKGYTHHDGSIGVLVQFEVGSDFTVRTQEFKDFSRYALLSLVSHFHQGGVIKAKPTLDPDFSSVLWLGPALFNNLGQALEYTSSQFQESITIHSWRVLDGTSPGGAGAGI